MIEIVLARDAGEVAMYQERPGRKSLAYSQSTKLFQGMLDDHENINKY